MNLSANDVFDIAAAFETLEHVPPQMVDGYLRKTAQHLKGYFFVTVPNEKGVVFLAKWLSKNILSSDVQHYSLSELMNATLGRMDLVDRQDHKGFDYDKLIVDIEKYFDVISVSGHPLGFLPHSLCFGVGIVAKSRD